MDDVFASPVAAPARSSWWGSRLATNTLDDRVDASPALVGGEIYLRGYKRLSCIAAP